MNDDASGRKARAKAQFNTVAAEYDAGPGCFAHFGRRLVTAAEIQPGQQVLDVATGRGAVLFPCAEQVGQTGQVVGVDLADEMVRATNEEAARRGISARAQVMDAEHLCVSQDQNVVSRALGRPPTSGTCVLEIPASQAALMA